MGCAALILEEGRKQQKCSWGKGEEVVARIRTIKPEFWTSAQVIECSPVARLLFIGLWNFCDDAGRHRWSLKQIKAQIFPADDISLDDVGRMLDELAAQGLVERYSSEGADYLYVTGWHHQRIDRPNEAKCPEPKVVANLPHVVAKQQHRPNSRNTRSKKINGLTPDSTNDRRTFDARRGEERIVKETLAGARVLHARAHEPPRSCLPKEWALDDSLTAVAKAIGLDTTEIIAQAARFIAWHRDKGTLSADWNAAWEKWCFGTIERRSPTTNSATRPSPVEQWSNAVKKVFGTSPHNQRTGNPYRGFADLPLPGVA